MPLTRDAPRLLRTVNNKSHATNEHHEEPERKPAAALPSSPPRASSRAIISNPSKVSDDVLRDPDSDSESGLEGGGGKESIKGWDRPTVKRPMRVPSGAKSARKVKDAAAGVRGAGAASRANESAASLPKLKLKTSSAAAAAAASSENPSDANGLDEADEALFASSQASNKRKKAGYGKVVKFRKLNTDAAEDANSDSSKGKVTFRQPTREKEGPDRTSRTGTRLALSRPRAAGGEQQAAPDSSQPGSSPPAGVMFRRPLGVGPVPVPASTETSAVSKTAESPASIRSRSSSLSSLSLLDSPGLIGSNPTRSGSYAATTPCPICGEEVDDYFKTDFLIEKCKGKRMNFRLQELFCKAHQESTHRKTWKAREYPEIDWGTLHKRLKKHNRRIRDVLSGKVDSYYRMELEGRLRSGKTKTAMQSWNNESQSRTEVGYYGSRGETVMTDHIVNEFGEELRRRAGSDKVVAAMGVSGGVSGYLQSVLVPEMALALVMEDAGCTADEGRRIISESSEIGEALNEEEDERVPRTDAGE